MIEDDIEMLSQPLLTEEGFLNEGCMNELNCAIRNMPKTYERLSGDSEWADKKDRWTTRSHIVGSFAMWACRQSPTGVPVGLEKVCGYLNEALKNVSQWDTAGMAEVSLCEINQWLYDILYEQGVSLFDAWNEGKDFIDLDALLSNVCTSIRDERRKNKAFDDKFEAEWKGKQEVLITE